MDRNITRCSGKTFMWIFLVSVLSVFVYAGTVMIQDSLREHTSQDGSRLRYLVESKLLGRDISQLCVNTSATADYVKQRVMLSRRLNKVMQSLAKHSCESAEAKVVKGKVISINGGWCRKASMEGGGNHMTDKGLLAALSKFLAGKSVASFGDGPGVYKREILKLGQVKSYDAYDGAPYAEETSEGRVKYMDLTVPQYGIPLYDWVVSLEVAEHIPEEFEENFLDNVIRHAREGIILSWATPGQGGLSHVNLRTVEYVMKKVTARGFSKDKKASDDFEASAKFSWFKKRPPWDPNRDEGNIQVFYRNKDNPAEESKA